jgi:iron complex transport system substrate-binding protein
MKTLSKLRGVIWISTTLLAFFMTAATASPAPKSINRIVAAGGSITEIIYALGAEEQLVAVDTSSLFPLSAMNLPKIGYYRQLSTEGVLSMNPSHVIAASGVGPESVMTQIKGAGVDMTVIEQLKSVEGVQRLITRVADIVGRQEEARLLNQHIQIEIEQLTSNRRPTGKKMVFLMSAGEGGLMAAGNNTMPQLILDLLKVENPFLTLDGFKPVSIEALLLADPNVILMPQHQVKGRTKELLCRTNELKFWAERHGCQLFFVDSLSFLGLTPRLPDALADTLSILENSGG